MIVLERRAVPGRQSHLTCDAPGCRHSARWDFYLLHGHVPEHLCTSCKDAWGKAYDDAYANWEHEMREAA